MSRTSNGIWTLKPLVVTIVAVLAVGCSDAGLVDPTAPELAKGGVAVQVFSPTDVIIAGTDNGAFVSFTANNSGRATTEFWDNPSADNNPSATDCNVGFFAAGVLDPDCLNSGGTPVMPTPGEYDKYFAANGAAPAAFMFNGDYGYHVRLLGTYFGLASEVGYFTNDGGYTFSPLSLVIGGSTIIVPGPDWGFYIANADGRLAAGGCRETPVFYHCSDAINGFFGPEFQQHALFQGGGKYLVGMEDNQLYVGPDAQDRDSDYNDYIFEVIPTFLEGRMTGGGIKIDDGKVTLGFTLHCDIKLANNLEINWGGNKFHMDRENLTDVLCTWQDEPKPPVAPFNTFEGIAHGRYNGVTGARAEFILVDNGEPGTDDKVRLKVFDANNTVVLDLPMTALNKGGNIQAHYDQPHGNKP